MVEWKGPLSKAEGMTAGSVRKEGASIAGAVPRCGNQRRCVVLGTWRSIERAWCAEVSRFFGISIRMYFDDHNPPHFHAIYGGTEVGINPLIVLRGRVPRRALGMVMEWAALHQGELLDN